MRACCPPPPPFRLLPSSRFSNGRFGDAGTRRFSGRGAWRRYGLSSEVVRSVRSLHGRGRGEVAAAAGGGGGPEPLPSEPHTSDPTAAGYLSRKPPKMGMQILHEAPKTDRD
jgi:hypothetical protein